MTEIYLPQQYAKSRKFRRALDKSLSPVAVQGHFRRRRSAEIKPFLPRRLRKNAEYKKLKQAFCNPQNPPTRSFGGYSVYDVEGTFVGKGKPDPDYDAVACVRIIDVPTNQQLFGRGNQPRNDLIRRVLRTVFAFRLHHDEMPKFVVMSGPEKAVAKQLDQWIDEGSFLLYGFLGYHLAKITKSREKEIWLTSHYAVVNRYRKRP